MKIKKALGIICLILLIALYNDYINGNKKETTETAENIIEEAADQIENIADANDPYVQGVKNGYPLEHPDQTYGEAFDHFFAYPTWKYFIGTKEGLDEDGDGEADYEEQNMDIVEFTGYCTYGGVEVKARIQFTLDKDGDTFETTYLSFNDVPQNMLTLHLLMNEVFQDGEEPDSMGKENTSDSDAEQTEENESKDSGADETASNGEWEDSYIRLTGPKCSFSIWSADENGITFALAIGASGYMSYVDMRDCQAKWTSDGAAVYTEDYGDRHYSLTFTMQNDRLLLSENTPYSEDFSLEGEYVREKYAQDEYEYVFPQADTNFLDSNDLNGKTAAECRIARNEIYARHGRIFNDEQLQGYFETCSWYQGSVTPENFSENVLNETEKANLTAIAEYEKKMGY